VRLAAPVAGALTSLILVVYVLADGPAGWLLQWVALAPALIGLFALCRAQLAPSPNADAQLAERIKELEILSRIDRELNYTLSVNRILNLSVDWLLRFTNSDAAAVALVQGETQMLQYVVGYGYSPQAWERLSGQPWPISRGIAGRVAQTGVPENVADTSQDPDYVEALPGARSQLAVPVTRQDRTIAVIRCESRTPGAFSAENLEFAVRLASRAAAAIDNANLLDAVERERQKLEVILRSTADAVIVVDHEGRLVLVNQAALAAFHLPGSNTAGGRSLRSSASRVSLSYSTGRALASRGRSASWCCPKARLCTPASPTCQKSAGLS